MLIYGEKRYPFEPVVFNSQNPQWRPFVVDLAGESDLFYGENILRLEPSHIVMGSKGLNLFFEKLEKKLRNKSYTSIVFFNLSLFSYKVLSHYRRREGEKAGIYAFDFTKFVVGRAISFSYQTDMPDRVYFSSFAKKTSQVDEITGEERDVFTPALGRKTLDLLIPRFNFIGFFIHIEGEPFIFFKTKTGKVLVKDPLGRLGKEKADLGLLEQKISEILKERSNEAHT